MRKDEFVIMKDKAWNVLRFTVKGHINATNATALQYELEDAVNKGHSDIALNLTQVEVLSSSGIRVILKVYKTLAGTGGSLRVERPSEEVRNVLGITALDAMLIK